MTSILWIHSVFTDMSKKVSPVLCELAPAARTRDHTTLDTLFLPSLYEAGIAKFEEARSLPLR